MQVIIDIDDEYYSYLRRVVFTDNILYRPVAIIAKGKPLPKGHGDLIDRSKLVPDCNELEIHDGDDWRNEYCGVSLTQIEEDAEVIVKADGGNEE